MTAFYLLARLRGVLLAEGALVVTVAAFSVVGPETIDVAGFTAPRAGPLIAAAAVQLVFAACRPASWRFFAGAGGLVLGLSIALRDRGFLARNGAIPAHLLIGIALAIGFAFEDRFARFLRTASAVLLAMLVPAAVYLHDEIGPAIPGWAVVAYAVAVPLLQVACWRLAREGIFLWLGGASALLSVPRLVGEAARLVGRLRWTRGTWMVVAGLAFFVLAAGISLTKAGVLGRRGPRPARPREAPGGGGEIPPERAGAAAGGGQPEAHGGKNQPGA